MSPPTFFACLSLILIPCAFAQTDTDKDKKDDSGKDTYRVSTVGGTTTNENSKETLKTTITGPGYPGLGGGGATSGQPPGGSPATWNSAGGMGFSPGGFYAIPHVLQSVQEKESKSIGIAARDYKLTIPKGNGVITETNIAVGASLTRKELILYLDQGMFGGGQPQTCTGPGIVYKTDAFRIDGQFSAIKGYKFGDQLFAYGMGGIESTVRYEHQKKDQSGGMGMIMPPNSEERFIYLGAVGEAGVGKKFGETTVMVGQTLKAGMNVQQGFPGGNMAGPNTGEVDMGGKVRVVSPKIIGSGYVSKSIGAEKGQFGGPPTDVLQYGCEVLIKVNPSLALGGSLVGEKREQHSESNGFAGGVSNDANVKTLNTNLKAVWVIPNTKKKKPASQTVE